MDFEFTSEQTQLGDAVRRFVDKDYGFEHRKTQLASAGDPGDAVWTGLVELGLTALPIPEAQGGFAGTAVDLLPVMQEFGRGLVAQPFFATMVAAEAIRRSNRAGALLGGVAEGTVKLAVAFGEKSSRHDAFAVKTKAERSGSGFRLTGEKSVVLFGAQADHLVVSAVLEGSLALFVVDAQSPGVERDDGRTLDGQRIADIRLSRVDVGADGLLAHGNAAIELLDATLDYGVALLCAEALGAMEALNAATLDYAKTRKQFGQPIARFQALQHRMVDMFIHLEQARSMAYLAAVHAASDDANARRRTISAAKVRIGQAARFIGQQAVQIHGGMGVTNELPAAHLFKRLTMIEMTFGDTDHHLQRFIATPEARPAVETATAEPLQRAA